MNKIRGLDSLEGLRDQLPSGPDSPKPRQARQEAPQKALSSPEADAYAGAFDALLTLWQVAGGHRGALPPAVKKAWTAASLKLRPIFNAA